MDNCFVANMYISKLYKHKTYVESASALLINYVVKVGLQLAKTPFSVLSRRERPIGGG
jgi:hypothetical protein